MSATEFFKRFLASLFVILLCLGVWAARSTLLYGFAAALIAVGLSIPTRWLMRYGWPRGWAITAAMLAFVNFILFLSLLVVPRLLAGFVELLRNIPDAITSLLRLYTAVRERSEFLSQALPVLGIRASSGEIDPDRAQALLQQIADASLAIAPSLLGGVGTLVAVVVNLVFVLFIAIFFLVDPNSYIKASLYLLPVRLHTRVIDLWNELRTSIQLWLTTLALSISITVMLVWLLLGVILGMPNAIVVAVFAGVATFIPNIGAFLPIIPITIFTLASDPSRLVLYIAVYLLIQFTESNVLTPSIVKAELEIPSGALMIFQLLATLAMGAVGLLLAVPLLATLIVLVREIYSYGLLGLRGVTVEVTSNREGEIVLLEANLPRPPDAESVVVAPLPKPE